MHHHGEPLPAYQIPVPSTPLLGSALSCAPYHRFALLPHQTLLTKPLPSVDVLCCQSRGRRRESNSRTVDGCCYYANCKSLSPPMCLSCPVLYETGPNSARQTYPAIAVPCPPLPCIADRSTAAISVLCRARDDVPCHCVAANPLLSVLCYQAIPDLCCRCYPRRWTTNHDGRLHSCH